MARTAKVHRSLRIDADTDAAVSELRTAEETMTDAINRVLRVGVETLQADKEEEPQDTAQEQETGRNALIEALQAHITSLENQLGVKDTQIEELNSSLRAAHSSLQAAQTLHAADKEQLMIEPPAAAQTAHDGTQDAAQGEHAEQDIPKGFWARFMWAMGR